MLCLYKYPCAHCLPWQQAQPVLSTSVIAAVRTLRRKRRELARAQAATAQETSAAPAASFQVNILSRDKRTGPISHRRNDTDRIGTPTAALMLLRVDHERGCDTPKQGGAAAAKGTELTRIS